MSSPSRTSSNNDPSSLKVGSPKELQTGEQPTLQRRSSKEFVGKSATAEFLYGKSSYMNELGRSFYDNVADTKKEPSVWEQVQKADKAPHPDKLDQ